MKISKLLLITIILLCNLPTFAQNVMTGKVYDKATGAPLVGVDFVGDRIIPHQKSSEYWPVIQTDINGNFTFKYKVIDSTRISFVALIMMTNDIGLPQDTSIDTISNTLELIQVGYYSVKIKIQPGNFNIGLESKPAILDEVVVTASRDYQDRVDAPVAINSLSYTAINDTKADHVDQIINQVPGVYMADVGNEQHFMAIRQPISSTNYFLYMEDGIPIRPTGDFNTNALLEIDQAAIQRVEIIKGPASSLYGSEAVGGTINFITMAPTITPTARLQLEDGSMGFHHADLYLSNTYKKLGILVSGYYAGRTQDSSLHNNYHKYAFDTRADYTFNPHTKLITSVDYINYYTDQKGGIDSAQFYSKSYTSNQRFTYRSTQALRAKTNLIHDWNNNNTTSATLYFRSNSIGQDPFYDIASVKSKPYYGTGQTNINDFNSYGAIVQHTKTFNFHHNIWMKWITGISTDYTPETFKANLIYVYQNQKGVNDSFTNPNTQIVNYKANILNSAAYTQFELHPTTHLNIVAGARYDLLAYKFYNYLPASATNHNSVAPDTSNHYNRITPKVGATYNFGHGIGLYANYSVGFAPPDVTDLYGGFSVPNIKPATFNNYEAGGWVSILHNKGYIEASVYELDGLNELIQVQQANGTALFENAGKTLHKGVEAAVNYTIIKGLIVRVGGTYTKQTYVRDSMSKSADYTGKYMADAPRDIINGMLTYKPVFIKGLRVSVEWQSLGKYWVDPNNTHPYNGFNVFNVRVGYMLPYTRLKGLEVWANCLNVGNTLYATLVTFKGLQDSFYPGMQRTYNVGLAYTFGK